MADSTPATAAERLIEVTIGLWPDDDPPGKRPPRLAAAIVKALRDEGFTILQPSEPATAAYGSPGPEHETVHRCPPERSGVMPCCGRTPFEVPAYHRMTVDPKLVTCGR